MKQDQFLDVIDRDEAERRFHAVIRLEPLGEQAVPVAAALGRVVSRDVKSGGNVPSFDRSNYDGFAVQAGDTYGATEEVARRVTLLDEMISASVVPACEIQPGTAAVIATGGMMPRGADAVVMIEDTDVHGGQVLISRAVPSGFGVTFAGTDIATGETVLRFGERLTSRETGLLAAIGLDQVYVFVQPKVGIISTGDEIIEPGRQIRPGQVYDSNARILADAVRELGGVPVGLGIVGDDADQLREQLSVALDRCDMVLLSGGTSKGAGDICYRVVHEMTQPGIAAHGVALKPGKPICLAAHQGKAVVVLPGFPTSAIFTFHEFVAPVIRSLAGLDVQDVQDVAARMAVRVNSQIGRTEYLLVGLVPRGDPADDAVSLSAYPMGKGSGSITTFSRADGFVTIERHQEIVEEGQRVEVRLLGRDLRLADLVVIGSHCIGLDFLLGQLQRQALHTKFLAVGSTGGLDAARRGECDLAGIHLLDPDTGIYNQSFLDVGLQLIEGYRRMQGIVYRPGDGRFEGRTVEQAILAAVNDPDCVMINRNQGSGTRILIDQLLRACPKATSPQPAPPFQSGQPRIDTDSKLVSGQVVSGQGHGGRKPAGYALQARNHHAVAAAVSQRRADWGLAIEGVTRDADLGFLPVTEEHYDFVVPVGRMNRSAVQAFRQLLADPRVKDRLSELGCHKR